MKRPHVGLRSAEQINLKGIKGIKGYLDLHTENKIIKKCIECLKVAIKEYERPVNEWRSELAPWDIIVENLRLTWGEKWSIYLLANLAGVVKLNKIESSFSNLLDHTKSLCRRVQYAKLHTEETDWWRKQFEIASSELDLMLVSLILLTWGSCDALLDLVEVVDNVSCQLADKWIDVIKSIQKTQLLKRAQPDDTELDTNILSFDIASLPEKLPERVVVALEARLTKDQIVKVYEKYLSSYRGTEITVLEFCQRAILLLVKSKQKYWQRALEIIAMLYAVMPYSQNSYHIELTPDIKSSNLPQRIAKEIIMHPKKYPRQLVHLAEARYRELVASKIVPVGEIAKVEYWFED